MNSGTSSESITFEEAIEVTHSLMSQMAAGTLSEEDTQTAIADLVGTANGARGFFVTYLTDDSPLADDPSPGTLQALQAAPEIVAELLVKNLAMSTAMAITHRRQENEEMAQGSDSVRSRTLNLIDLLNRDDIAQMAAQMKESATKSEGTYASFLQRWGYDDEQRQAICHTIDRLKYLHH